MTLLLHSDDLFLRGSLSWNRYRVHGTTLRCDDHSRRGRTVFELVWSLSHGWLPDRAEKDVHLSFPDSVLVSNVDFCGSIEGDASVSRCRAELVIDEVEGTTAEPPWLQCPLLLLHVNS